MSREGSASIRLGWAPSAAGNEGLWAFLHLSLMSPGPANSGRRCLPRVIHGGQEQEEGDHCPASLPSLLARGAAQELDRALGYYCKMGSAAGSCDQQTTSWGTFRH